MKKRKEKIKRNADLFHSYSIRGIIDLYRKGTISPVEVADITLDNLDRYNDRFKVMVCYDRTLSLDQAKNSEARYRRIPGKTRLLDGIPLGIKDIFNTADFPTQMGSPLWKGFTPGNDARAVFSLRQEGAIIPGKTETAEFAVHTLDATLNPHNPLKTPGTSSSGSAAGVALGFFPAAIGTQTAGSIVRPASFCGVYGCKPSFGLIPRTGTLKTSDTLDTIGFFTNFQEDLTRVFEILRVKGPDYPVSYKYLKDSERQTKPGNRPWKVAFVKTHTWKNTAPYAQKAMLDFAGSLSKLKGVEVTEVAEPAQMRAAHTIHATIYNKTLSYYFNGEFERSELVSKIMNDLIRNGQKITPAEYQQALKEQTELALAMDRFFEKHDVLISLSTAGEAPDRQITENPDPALMWTMSHLPVISAPAFLSPDKLPFGLQIASRKYNDYLLFGFVDFLAKKGLLPKKTNPTLSLLDDMNHKGPVSIVR
jgi:Asp-tRNA(Asn)/Glu-tRNA(Gln) amidotransferase A subunit family amidase